MKLKHIFYGIIGFSIIIAYNLWLIEKDKILFKKYYGGQEVKILTYPPSSKIK